MNLTPQQRFELLETTTNLEQNLRAVRVAIATMGSAARRGQRPGIVAPGHPDPQEQAQQEFKQAAAMLNAMLPRVGEEMNRLVEVLNGGPEQQA